MNIIITTIIPILPYFNQVDISRYKQMMLEYIKGCCGFWYFIKRRDIKDHAIDLDELSGSLKFKACLEKKFLTNKWRNVMNIVNCNERYE